MAGALRKKNDDQLLLALACGATVEAAAKQCDLSDRTVYKRLKEPEFRTRLKDLRGDMVRRSSGMLTTAATEAVRTLLGLLKESNPATIRLGAARAVLEIGIKIRAMAELEVDMMEMEERINSLESGRNPSGPTIYPRVIPKVGGDADPNAI